MSAMRSDGWLIMNDQDYLASLSVLIASELFGYIDRLLYRLVW